MLPVGVAHSVLWEKLGLVYFYRDAHFYIYCRLRAEPDACSIFVLSLRQLRHVSEIQMLMSHLFLCREQKSAGLWNGSCSLLKCALHALIDD